MKVNPGKIVRQVDETRRPVLLTSRGRGVAVAKLLPSMRRRRRSATSFAASAASAVADLEAIHPPFRIAGNAMVVLALLTRLRVPLSRRSLMVALIQDKRDAIVGLCRRYEVVRMDVFGSVLRDDFRPGVSDVDLLVEFSDRDPYALAQAYFDLLDELNALLGTKVDLVMAGAVKNRYIVADIEATRQPLYAA